MYRPVQSVPGSSLFLFQFLSAHSFVFLPFLFSSSSHFYSSAYLYSRYSSFVLPSLFTIACPISIFFKISSPLPIRSSQSSICVRTADLLIFLKPLLLWRWASRRFLLPWPPSSFIGPPAGTIYNQNLDSFLDYPRIFAFQHPNDALG
jgi:hypothetical protein